MSWRATARHAGLSDMGACSRDSYLSIWRYIVSALSDLFIFISLTIVDKAGNRTWVMPICNGTSANCGGKSEKCPAAGNVKTQFISILRDRGGYTTCRSTGNGDSDVRNDGRHTHVGGSAAGPSDSDGHAERQCIAKGSFRLIVSRAGFADRPSGGVRRGDVRSGDVRLSGQGRRSDPVPGAWFGCWKRAAHLKARYFARKPGSRFPPHIHARAHCFAF